jgi:arginine decarboxylase
MALMGVKIGKKVIIVVEKLSELRQVISVARELGVTPLVGIRTKMYSKGSGKWESSGGEFAKFGLTTPELLQAVNILKAEGLEDSFKLLHFHIGSQITNIKTVKDAVKEGARIYSKLRKMGLGLEFLDVGGGLGVDYDGSRTSFDSSINYSLAEYVSDVVYSIKEICEAEEVPEPNIVTESGRAMVAQQSVLIFDAIGANRPDRGAVPTQLPALKAGEEELPRPLVELFDTFKSITERRLIEQYHDACEARDEAGRLFSLGYLSLEHRAMCDNLFWATCARIRDKCREVDEVPEELEATP